MYPARELSVIELRKQAVLLRIAVHRQQCVVAAGELARPVVVAEGLWSQWKRISPLLKLLGVPLGLFVARKAGKRVGGGGLKLLRFAPLIFQTARSFMAARRARQSAPAAVAQADGAVR